MPNTSKITGAPAELTFVDGSTYRMSPLTDKDISELDNWVRTRHIKIAMEAARELPQDEAEELRQIAMMQAATLSWMSGMGARLMATVDGMARLAWQGLHRNHPEVSLEDLRERMFEPANVDAVNKRFEELNLPDEAIKKGAKSQRRRRRKKRKRS